jgi:Fic-DOC domain mobile mystery protein B
MRTFLGDAAAWVAAKAYEPDELALRFHHRLVFIQAFPNGNGRHSRTMADLMILALGEERFSWGGANLTDITETRRRYIEALQAADAFDMRPLIAFARS